MPGKQSEGKPARLPASARRLRRAFLYLLYLAVAVYIPTEIVFSAFFAERFLDIPDWFYVIEDGPRTARFEPKRGYTLLEEPSRQAKITQGTVEYVGAWRGNNQGFPDQDDFLPERPDDRTLRVAVFGDSFTAAQYIETNWPDRVEDLARADGYPLQLLNCSIDGGGLANWYSILLRVLRDEDYQLDAVLFAVAQDDLERSFHVVDHSVQDCHLFGYVQSWELEKLPKTLEEALPVMDRCIGHIVPHERFEAALHGAWNPNTPPWRPYLFLMALDTLTGEPAEAAGDSADAEARDPFIDEAPFNPILSMVLRDMALCLAERDWPVLCVRLPERQTIYGDRVFEHELALVREFAGILRADTLYGVEAFDPNAPPDPGWWLPYDPHWAQAGSDRFARWLYPRLRAWLAATCPRAGADSGAVPG